MFEYRNILSTVLNNKKMFTAKEREDLDWHYKYLVGSMQRVRICDYDYVDENILFALEFSNTLIEKCKNLVEKYQINIVESNLI